MFCRSAEVSRLNEQNGLNEMNPRRGESRGLWEKGSNDDNSLRKSGGADHDLTYSITCFNSTILKRGVAWRGGPRVYVA